jgi:hypothetical protein
MDSGVRLSSGAQEEVFAETAALKTIAGPSREEPAPSS